MHSLVVRYSTNSGLMIGTKPLKVSPLWYGTMPDNEDLVEDSTFLCRRKLMQIRWSSPSLQRLIFLACLT